MNKSDSLGKILSAASVEGEASSLVARILNTILKNHNYLKTSQEEMLENSIKIIKACKWLGFFDKSTKVI